MDKEQARKLYELADRLSKLDVNTLSEEQLAERTVMIAQLQEVKQRLDPKCWTGKHKEGTKIKGGVRVNNCVPNESIEEGSSNIGNQIRALYQKIYNAGDDAIEFMYNDSPIFAQYWDEYEGDLDSIIAEVNPQELQVIYSELQSAAEDQGIAEAGNPAQQAAIAINMKKHHKKPMGEADGEYDDEAGMAQSSLQTMSRAVNGLMDTIQQGDNLPEWAQEKLSLAEDYLTTVWDYLLSQKEQGIEPKLEEASQRVDSLVTDALKLMRGSEVSDAVRALTTVLGNREYNSRRGHYNFYIKQMIDMYNKQGVTETKKPSPKLTPVNIKKTDPVSEEINTEAYERLQKVFAFKNYES